MTFDDDLGLDFSEPSADEIAWLDEQLREAENGGPGAEIDALGGTGGRPTVVPPGKRPQKAKSRPEGVGAGDATGARWDGGTAGRSSPAVPVPLAGAPSADVPEPRLVIVSARAFAAVDEPSADPLLGDVDNNVSPAGGTVLWYGDGGAGKTTLVMDGACHVCSGTDWLGLPVAQPRRGVWLENEGPRGMFRVALERKLEAWEGPDPALAIVEQPWSRFSFADDGLRAELVAYVRDEAIDVMFAGPISRLGVHGGGTPEEIQAFVNLLEAIRDELERPLAYQLVHHENKSGDVSGAWEGATDTLAHVQGRGQGHTAIFWRKVRWGSSLHGTSWKLDWRPGWSFALDDTPETPDEVIAEELLAAVAETPGKSWNYYRALISGGRDQQKRVRDQLLESGRLVDANAGKKPMALYLPSQVDALALDLETETPNEEANE